MSLRKIKVGMIGAGFIGPVHIESLRRLGFVEVVALATSKEETARSKAEVLSIPKAYGDYRDLIEDEEVEVVQITSPNYLHFPQVKAALEADKHVVCDKPLAINSQESKILVELAKKKGVVNAVSFNNRFYPLVQHSRAIIGEDVLGSVCTIRGTVLDDWLLYSTDYNWRVERSKGGPLQIVASLGCHLLDLIQFVSGLRIISVFANLDTIIPFRKKPINKGYELKEVFTEDYAALLLRLENKARGVVVLSQLSAGRKVEFSLEIDGLKGSLAWNSRNPNELWQGFREKPNSLLLKEPSLLSPSAKKYAAYPGGHTEGYADAFKQCFKNIYEHILLEKQLSDSDSDFPTFETGHEMQCIMDGIKKSAEIGGWVDVEYS